MSEKSRSTRRFSADRYRRMAARFSQLPEEEAPTALSLCHWENNGGKTDDGDPDGYFVPDVEERTLVAMLLQAAEMLEREERK